MKYGGIGQSNAITIQHLKKKGGNVGSSEDLDKGSKGVPIDGGQGKFETQETTLERRKEK